MPTKWSVRITLYRLVLVGCVLANNLLCVRIGKVTCSEATGYNEFGWMDDSIRIKVDS